MLTTGEFSRLTHLSVRTLRRYHEAGPLVPATVDQSTGYRHYAVEQIPFGPRTGHGHVVVYLPTPRPPRTGRVRPLTLPAAELAVATHHGSHDDIDVTYGQLGTWVVHNALSVTGPVRETYLIGPRDTPDPAAWRTEIAWPVFGLAAPVVHRA